MPAAVYPPPPPLTAVALAGLSEEQRQLALSDLSVRDQDRLAYLWDFWARAEQRLPEPLPTGDWRVWLILAGRGSGKTRTGAEAIRGWVESGESRRSALVARTGADARDVIVEGESGIMAISPPDFRPAYNPSKRRLTWPNGAQATVYSADEPATLRGPQHDKLWADELAAWRYPEAWDQAMFGLRLGTNPQAVVTTTPRPTPLIKELRDARTTVVTRGTSYDNRANLPPAFYEEIVKKYEGTRLGRQELLAEVLDDNPLALWTRGRLDELRLGKDDVPPLHSVVVAVDPSVHDGTADPLKEDLAQCGIVVAGAAKVGGREHAYVLEDLTMFGAPHDWGTTVIRAYNRHHADRTVAEVNNGGALVEMCIRAIDKRVSYKAVHASRGKLTRAEPVSALYEKGMVHHVGAFPVLEDQMCDWVPGDKSPDAMDALVWGITYLLLKGKSKRMKRS